MRAYPPEKRQAVLADVPELGISGSAQAHGVNKATVSRWANDAGIATVATEQTRAATDAARLRWEQRRTDMGDRIGAAADMALVQTVNALAGGNARTAKDAATTMAILVDKAQLLTGGATSRTQIDRTAALGALDELTERRQRRSA